MLAGGTDELYRRILSAGHQLYSRVEVWTGGPRPRPLIGINAAFPDWEPAAGTDFHDLTRIYGDPEPGLVYLPGSAVNADLAGNVTRNLTLMVPGYLYPRRKTDPLAVYGNELRTWRGVRLPGGTQPYIWQTFRGRIQTADKDSRSATCVITASDRAQEVIDHGFVTPQNSIPGAITDDEWRRLVRDAVPDAEFGPSDSFPQKIPALAWEFNRVSAVDEMIAARGGLWYALADGRYVSRRYPWTYPADPVITLTDGPGGIILHTSRSQSRREIYNVVTVRSERLNGDLPVVATASDTTPGSPTMVGGNFGTRSLLRRRQTPQTQGGAQASADALLRSVLSPGERWTWVTPADGSVELGDVVRLRADDDDVIQVVQGFSLPLDVRGEMVTSGRSMVVGAVQGGLDA